MQTELVIDKLVSAFRSTFIQSKLIYQVRILQEYYRNTIDKEAVSSLDLNTSTDAVLRTKADRIYQSSTIRSWKQLTFGSTKITSEESPDRVFID